MKQQKTKVTNKKFYNKWLYKVTLKIEGAGMLRSPFDQIREVFNGPEPKSGYSYAARNWQHRGSLLDVIDFLESKPADIWTKRIEREYVDFYTNDKDFYEELSTVYENRLVHRFEPAEGQEDLLDKVGQVIVKKLPKNRYQHRVYLLPHKMANRREEKQQFVDWLKKQSPKITCTPAIESWFIRTDWNWDRRYVLVEDEATLLMLKLRNSEVVGRIHNFIISDK